MRRKILTFCVTILLLFACFNGVSAEEFDPSKTGSISVTLMEQNQNEPIVGANFSVYYVATARLDPEGDLIYNYTEDFARLDIALDDMSLAEKLDGFVAQETVPSIKITTNAQGMATCEELPIGLYFVKQTGAVEGFAPCASFLVTVPNVENGEYVYQVNASPKTEVTKLISITIKKVWNTDASAAATESVTVQLLKDGTVVKTAVLNDANDWQVTYANMPQSDDYTIEEVGIPQGFTATYSKTGYTFTVTNTATLIQTGQRIWPIPVLAVAGMLLIVAGTLLLQKKRKTNG